MLAYNLQTTGNRWESPEISWLTRVALMREDHFFEQYGAVDPADGPVFLFFDAMGTHPGAKDEQVFGAAAVLSQAGKTIATFQALANAEYQRATHGDGELPGPWNPKHWQHYHDAVASMPKLADNLTLNIAFGDFLAWCWQHVWQAFESQLPAHGEFKWLDDLVQNGWFHVVRNGMCASLEDHLFYRALPSNETKEVAFGKENTHASCSLCHPYHIQTMHSLVTAMGYVPTLPDHSDVTEALGLEYQYPSPLMGVTKDAAIFWAAKNGDPRLEPFKAQGW